MKAGTLLGILAALTLVAGGGFAFYQLVWKKNYKPGTGSGTGSSSGGSGTGSGSGGSGTGSSSSGSGSGTTPITITGKATLPGQRIFALDNTTPYYYQGLGTPIVGYYFPAGSYIGTTDEIGNGYLKVTTYTGPPKNAQGQEVRTFYIPNKIYRLG